MSGKVINLKDKPCPSEADYVYIGRRQWCGKELFPASPWANSFSVKKYGREEAIRRYEERLRARPDLMAHLPELRGKTLACRCAPEGGLTKDDPLYCHGQVLLRLIEEAA
jgi:hypothetical protein